MNDVPKYRDKRTDQWRRWFEQAADYDAYLAQSEADKAQRWRDMAPNIPPLTDQQQQRLTGHNRQLNVLVYSGVWCGDCVRQGPMFQQIADACAAALLANATQPPVLADGCAAALLALAALPPVLAEA